MEEKRLDYPFEIRIEDEGEDLFYVLRYKDFDNVIGVGATMEEAMESGKKALEAELAFLAEQGKPAPKPTVTNPLIDVSGRVTLRMPKALHRKLITRSEEDGVSLNTTILTALAEYLASEEKGKDEFFYKQYLSPAAIHFLPTEDFVSKIAKYIDERCFTDKVKVRTYKVADSRA